MNVVRKCHVAAEQNVIIRQDLNIGISAGCTYIDIPISRKCPACIIVDNFYEECPGRCTIIACNVNSLVRPVETHRNTGTIDIEKRRNSLS